MISNANLALNWNHHLFVPGFGPVEMYLTGAFLGVVFWVQSFTQNESVPVINALKCIKMRPKPIGSLADIQANNPPPDTSFYLRHSQLESAIYVVTLYTKLFYCIVNTSLRLFQKRSDMIFLKSAIYSVPYAVGKLRDV